MNANRRTVVVQGPLAFRMYRLAAADRGALGLQLTTLPLLAARLAGGFFRPAQSEDLESAIQSALAAGGFAEIEPIRSLPGMPRAATRTLRKLWDADVSLEAARHHRFADIALLERRVRDALPPSVLTPRDLRERALRQIKHAPNALGALDLDRLLEVPPVWRSLIRELREVVPVRWIEPGTPDVEWFTGEVVASPHNAVPPPQVVTCANSRSEVMESLRWARFLLATRRARASDIAICAASTDEWDDHVLTLAKGADQPIHFSNGIPALSTRDGQACAALADLLINGLSQDRVRRAFNHAIGQGRRLEGLGRDWAIGISPEAGLFQLEHWRRALTDAASHHRPNTIEIAVLESALALVARGIGAAEEAGHEFLGPSARLLWQRALKSGPASALDLSLQALRLADESEPGTSIVWCPATHLVGAPRAYVWLLGLTSGTWPVRSREDPLLPDHLLSRKILNPDPIGDQQRRAFELICARASGACWISRSRRSSQGGLLPASPLLAPYAQGTPLKRGRIPQHAFSETDRLLARPQDAATSPRLRSAMGCWSDWNTSKVTPHDGLAPEHQPIIGRALQRTQSATSLAHLLRDPLSFVWRYALGWYAPPVVEQPLSLDARAWGELVHEVLRRTVNLLEPNPGYTRASHDALRHALRTALCEVRDEWPLTRPVPPLLLWQHTLAHAEQLAFKALTQDESFHPKTRCWTEVPFGSPDVVPGDWPWDTTATVIIPGTTVPIRGTIDRLDRNATRTSVRVTDYKTGSEPPEPAGIVARGGSDLQRVIYAIAAIQLLPEARRVVARLFYLRADPPRPYELSDINQAIRDVGGYVAQACALLNAGKALPGPVRADFDDYRIALPAASDTYFAKKRAAFYRAFGTFARIWNAP
jgi:hypothetical protein